MTEATIFQRIAFVSPILDWLLTDIRDALQLTLVNSTFASAIHGYCPESWQRIVVGLFSRGPLPAAGPSRSNLYLFRFMVLCPTPPAERHADSTACATGTFLRPHEGHHAAPLLSAGDENDNVTMDLSWILVACLERGGLDPNMEIQHCSETTTFEYPPTGTRRSRVGTMMGILHAEDEPIVQMPLLTEIACSRNISSTVVNLLLDAGADIHGGARRSHLHNNPHGTANQQNNPLLAAIASGNDRCIRLLFSWAECNNSSEEEEEDLCAQLINRATSAASDSRNGGTLLHHVDATLAQSTSAVQRRYIPILRALLDCSPHLCKIVDATDSQGFTVLQYAALISGANAQEEEDDENDDDTREFAKRTAAATTTSVSAAATSLLLSYGANPAIQNARQGMRSALHLASQNGNVEVATVLLQFAARRLDAGARANDDDDIDQQMRHRDDLLRGMINSTTADGASALMLALRGRHSRTACALLEEAPIRSIDINAQDCRDGRCALHHAVEKGIVPVVEMLCEQRVQQKLMAPVDANLRDTANATPMSRLLTTHSLVAQSCYTTRPLQQKSDDDDHDGSDDSSQSAHEDEQKQQQQQQQQVDVRLHLARLLLQLGARPDPLFIFSAAADDEFLAVLDEVLGYWGVDVNTLRRSASAVTVTPLLIIAARNGASETVQLLLNKYGADAMARDSMGSTAEEVADSMGLEHVSCLIRNFRQERKRMMNDAQ